jgi:hypothetical protein
MKRCIPLLALLALPMLCLAVDPVPAADPPKAQPPAPPDFGWLSDLVGSCWVAKLPDARLHTQCYSRQFGHFIRSAATLSQEIDGTWRPIFAGDSVFAADAARHIVYFTWGSDGGYRQLTAHYEGDQIVFPVAARATPQRVANRTLWKRLDKDSFEVRREKAGDDGKSWTEDLKITYRRAPPPESKAK